MDNKPTGRLFPLGQTAGVDDRSRGPQPVLTGRRVRLRPWRPDDAPAVHAACQDPELQRWTEVPVPYLPEHAAEFVGPVAATTWADGGALFAVEDLGDGGLVGAMTLFGVRDGVGAVGYWTAPERRGQGLTGEALRLLSSWALDVAGVRRVELIADPANTGSCRVAESAGFSAEGVLRQRYLHRGVPGDVVLHSLLATDPRPPV
jgi:RimJ/RimL family protein N-acetyltransferase